MKHTAHTPYHLKMRKCLTLVVSERRSLRSGTKSVSTLDIMYFISIESFIPAYKRLDR